LLLDRFLIARFMMLGASVEERPFRAALKGEDDAL
jgi:hypothetical protein